MASYVVGLSCRACCTSMPASRLVNTCMTCGGPLLVDYDMDRVGGIVERSTWASRPPTMWRYRELLPLNDPAEAVSLGEPITPIVTLSELDRAPSNLLLLKDDGRLPLGSFKARGMAVAVSRARALGAKALFAPSAGNAGAALAAYAARAGLRSRVYLPAATSEPFRSWPAALGAETVLVDGTIREAGERARSECRGDGWFEMSTLREPYRVEGKKTMGFEMFDQLHGRSWPDAILYPTGGGTGLLGLAKAFDELTQLGWIERRPRLIAVQPDRCAPIVKALDEGTPRAAPWPNPSTVAPGLLVPSPFGSERVLEAIRLSGGAGVTVSDQAILDAMGELLRRHGVSASPEGAATYAGALELLERGTLRAGETVPLYNTGSGLPFDLAALRDLVPAGSPP
ncbi:MAG: threonine synthase [Thermoplasmata archaeon]|nr:threonine synthase [Thermoplasmata archaeon]